MRVAILGASSQIARDLILKLSCDESCELLLFSRDASSVDAWLGRVGLVERYHCYNFSKFTPVLDLNAIINFVGAGDPTRVIELGAEIFEITNLYDQMAMDYVRRKPHCRYLFLSSGSAYGSIFEKPAQPDSKACFSINSFRPEEWYGVAKFYAEARHRAHQDLPIFDIRVFNYFSRTQDMRARFLITDILRAIKERRMLTATSESMARDYIHPGDFFQLVSVLLRANPDNCSVDVFSKAPTTKQELFQAMADNFGLKYELVDAGVGLNATGRKPQYFSENYSASRFGYAPGFAALEGVLIESNAILKGDSVA